MHWPGIPPIPSDHPAPPRPVPSNHGKVASFADNDRAARGPPRFGARQARSRHAPPHTRRAANPKPNDSHANPRPTGAAARRGPRGAPQGAPPPWAQRTDAADQVDQVAAAKTFRSRSFILWKKKGRRENKKKANRVAWVSR